MRKASREMDAAFTLEDVLMKTAEITFYRI